MKWGARVLRVRSVSKEAGISKSDESLARTSTLEFLLSALGEVGLVSNRSGFKIFAVNDDEDTLGFIPDWLRTPDTRPQMGTERGGVVYGMELLGAPIGHVFFENEWPCCSAR